MLRPGNDDAAHLVIGVGLVQRAVQRVDAPFVDVVEEHVEGRLVELNDVRAGGLELARFLVQQFGDIGRLGIVDLDELGAQALMAPCRRAVLMPIAAAAISSASPPYARICFSENLRRESNAARRKTPSLHVRECKAILVP